ncbi:MAG: adenylyl-sulfate kinase [Chloroflexi bacterium]|nr:adenylyl-sulfate kinase [Chloroflexota bacterium]
MYRHDNTGRVIWLTGLPGAGKTTIANRLEAHMVRNENGIEVLDGDQLRKGLSADLGFSEDDRNEHNRRVVFLAKLLVRNGIDVIVSLVSPYRENRKIARQEFDYFTEVYVKCSLDECMRRDPKGLYAKAKVGEITDMTGLQSPYEAPLSAEVVVDTEVETEEESVSRILLHLGEQADEKSLIARIRESSEVVAAHVC